MMLAAQSLLAVAFTAFAVATPPPGPPGPPGPHGPPSPPGGPSSSGPSPPHGGNAWSIDKLTSLVAFGDSYTDDSRLSYFYAHNGSAPPVGWVNPVNYHAADGGRVWAEYVGQYTGAHVYNYAVAGAVCSNNITPRSAGTFLFPAVEQYEIPAFFADKAYREPNGEKFLDVPVDSTVYAIWIGTNDLGNAAFLTDSQVKGTNLTTYVQCVYDSFTQLYNGGARYFVLINNAPLNLAPQYALPGEGGLNETIYWTNKPTTGANLTEDSYRMMEQVVTTNEIFEYRTPFEVKIANAYPGSHWAVYNVHDLMTDIYNHPAEYLNGSAPLNVTGYVNTMPNPSTSPDSFMWFDPLHPSQQTERVIARNFVDVVRGCSKWATYWSS